MDASWMMLDRSGGRGQPVLAMNHESQAAQLIDISNQQPGASSLIDPRDAAGTNAPTPRAPNGLKYLQQRMAQTENYIQVMISGPIAIAVVVAAILAGLLLLP